MKITAITMMMLLSGGLAYGESEFASIDHSVTVCLDSGTVSAMTVIGAKMLASRIFGQIGVSINWQHASRKCPAEAIRVKLSKETPSSLRPGALAYALLQERLRIEVFYDRISSAFDGPMVQIVLAHVLVHEITHIVQGINRHSAKGVMKARWDPNDLRKMTNTPLAFAPEDVLLIYAGLAARQNSAMLAMNTDQTRAIAGR